MGGGRALRPPRPALPPCPRPRSSAGPCRHALRQLRAVRGAGLRRQPLPARHLPGGRRQRHGPSPETGVEPAGGARGAASVTGPARGWGGGPSGLCGPGAGAGRSFQPRGHTRGLAGAWSAPLGMPLQRGCLLGCCGSALPSPLPVPWWCTA